MPDREEAVQRLMGLHDDAAYKAHLFRAFGTIGAEGEARAARSTLESALREALMPAGWKLVPVEPTPEMVTAGMDGLGSCVGSCGEASPPDRSDIADSYRAMLSAAPAFPVELEQPEQPKDLGDAAARPGLSVADAPTIPIAAGDVRSGE